MAERPIFIPTSNSPKLVQELSLQLTWHPGFAAVQKARNIKALHAAANAAGYRVLEVSTKSDQQLGQQLSAFNLKVKAEALGDVPLECAFQGSKVFQSGGPFTDLYQREPREAKRDPRLNQSGQLIGFQFGGLNFPLEPKTVFYDWLYLNCICRQREWTAELEQYGGFSDIEFNPQRSINCQARSVALFLSLMKRGKLDEAMRSAADFIRILSESAYRPRLRS